MGDHHSRRTNTGSSRREHSHHQYDATAAIVEGYGERINSEFIGAWQIPPGSIGEGKIQDGGLDGGIVIIPGTLPPDAFDGIAPKLPTIVSFDSDVGTSDDGTTFVRLIVAVTHATLNEDETPCTDLNGVIVQFTRDFTGTGEVAAPDWNFPVEHFISRDSEVLVATGVMGATKYWMRAKSRDIQGNESAGYTSEQSVITVGDEVAPGVPQQLSAVAGFKGAIVKFNRVTDSDLDHYVVRYCLDAAGVPSGAWTELDSGTTNVWIGGLTPGLTYWFDVSAVDRSGNQSAEATPVSCIPLKVGDQATDIAAHSISTEMISTNGLDASVIKSGFLLIEAGSSGKADGIRITDDDSTTADKIVGEWDENGLVLYERDNKSRRIVITSGSLKLIVGSNVVAAITPDGIDASAILFGRLPSGHNQVPNSSFEVGPYATEQSYAHTTFTVGAGVVNTTYTAGVITITTLP